MIELYTSNVLRGRNALLKTVAATIVFGAHMGASSSALALTLSDLPLITSTNAAPNVILTLDDSGSMSFAYAPDSQRAVFDSRRFKSAAWNPLYYNPAVTYAPAVDVNGNGLSTSFTKAWVNGFDPSRGFVDLSSGYIPTVADAPQAQNPKQFYHHSPLDFPITNLPVRGYYYLYDKTLETCSGSTADDNCYKLQYVLSSEEQNFAIWYSFYRTRSLLMVTNISRAFAQFNGEIRLAWQALNTCNSFTTGACSGWDSSVSPVDNRMGSFSGQHRNDFYTWLARFPNSGGTPLLSATRRAGEYLKATGPSGPYAFDPMKGIETPLLSCRKSYHVLVTDGAWNDGSSVGNVDSTARALPDGKSYSPYAPMSDGNSSSLADVAFLYWATDLQPGIADNVTQYMPEAGGTADANYWNPRNDPAKWQHMTNFMVSLGITTSLSAAGMNWAGETFGGDYAALASGTKTWPSVSPDSAANVADLWHAAINSRGLFFSADDPTGLANAMRAITRRIGAGIQSASAIASNTSKLETGAMIYQAQYNSADWSGELTAYPVHPLNGVGTAAWTASASLSNPDAATRAVLTFRPSTNGGAPFRWTALDASQQSALQGGDTVTVGQERLDWLRGSAAKEIAGGFRLRAKTKLGDIVNSSPQYVGRPAGQYEQMRFASNYQFDPSWVTFFDSRAGRTPVIYVGANDGMLHGFDAVTGKELLAYIPGALFGNLRELTDPAYNHKFFVDGTPTIADAKLSGNWRTILVGGLNKGGKGVYALDVTDPAAFLESSAASTVMWEFTNTQDVDLGYTYARPMIAKMNGGKWAAVIGNGYGSTNNKAVLYILFLQEGKDGWQAGDFVKLDTAIGSAAFPNGLSSVNAMDMDLNGTIDVIYAGDLLGNLWKFDVSDIDQTKWKVGNGGEAVFTACAGACKDASGNPVNRQSITAKPELTFHPKNLDSVLVYVGTGRLLEAADRTSSQVQSMYGIWDNNWGTTITDRAGELLKQTITLDAADPTVRSVSNLPVTWYDATTKTGHKGWYQDLPVSGERTIVPAQLHNGALVYSTVVWGTASECEVGGDSWLLAVDFRNGGGVSGVLDTNHDGAIDAKDAANGIKLGNFSVASLRLLGGYDGNKGFTLSSSALPRVVDASSQQGNGSSPPPDPPCPSGMTCGGLQPPLLPKSRISWRQLFR